MLTFPVKGAYDIRQEVPIGVCMQIFCMGLMAFKSIVLLKVIRVGHFQTILLLVKNLKLL
jgi:hypothetical protein